MSTEEIKQLKKLVNSLVPTPVVEPIVPLTKFQPGVFAPNYTIKRTKTLVKFGCGAVTVKKKDLLTVAEFLELEEKYLALKEKAEISLSDLEWEWRKHDYNITENNIKVIGSKKLRQIAGN